MFVTLLLVACRNPLDGVTIGLKDPIQDGVVEFQFYDPAGNSLPVGNQIKIAGPDAQQVVTTLNTKKYKINSDGDLLLAALPGTSVSAQSPFRFTVVAEAYNYLPVVQSVVLTSLNRQTRPIRRISLLNPPPTLNAALATGRADANGAVAATFGVTTAAQKSDADHAMVTLTSGTKLTNREGNVVGGELVLSVIHTNARSDEAASYIPGGGIMSAVAGRNGGPSLGNFRFLTIAGSVTIKVYNEQYELVRSLSPAGQWTMDLNPNAYNVSKSRAIQVGDSIPLFSYDEFISRWQMERPGVVSRNAQTGRLECRAEAAQAVAYVAGWAESICAEGPYFKVSSKLANVDVNYLCKLIDVTTGKQAASFYANANNGSVIRITNQSKNRKLKLQLYDETDAWGKGTKGGLIAESGTGVSCDQTPVAINLAALPVPPVMKLEFSFSCPNGTTLNEASLPALIITQYSEVGQGNWHDLIRATRTNRKATSYKLKVGRHYDFRASTDGGATWPLHQPNYLVDKPEWILKIRAEMYCK
ncbi:hypothetical protein [Spirosoma pollinicola]|uniref:Uncharacterized protein n=1 Tax=Spirosoma pollinicola TaxID=2057025 RepID=A0A2K8ZC28_9BACT|nr:hypothetical protein [Spirosoma pollinicola]AUD07437.1 hypothetical protein CWM47_22965 [Spirosoma pollinicola]